METELVERIVVALRHAAENERLLSYQRFHVMCGASYPLTVRYEALERAVSVLGDLSKVDYGVLLTLSNGLPGPDFFRRFQRHRHADYVAVIGSPVHGQSIKRRRILVEGERRRVYEYAKQKMADPAAQQSA